MSLLNPLQGCVEFWLAVYNCLPYAFHAYLNLVLAIAACTAVVALIWRLN